MDNKLFWCTTCLSMSTRPRISFDREGQCNACQWKETKKKIDWNKRKAELSSFSKTASLLFNATNLTPGLNSSNNSCNSETPSFENTGKFLT